MVRGGHGARWRVEHDDEVARAVLVTGLAGFGKSGLCHEFSREAGQSDEIPVGSAQAAGIVEGAPYSKTKNAVNLRCQATLCKRLQ